MKLFLAQENDTIQFARNFASLLDRPLVLSFKGEIGAGKTTFIRALLQALGVDSKIKSPSYSLIETYQLNPFTIHHIDLYRIADASELDYLGFRDLLAEPALLCIEWPERAGNFLPPIDMAFSMSLHLAGRMLEISALTPPGQILLSKIKD